MKVWEEEWAANWDVDYAVTLERNGARFGTVSAGGPDGVLRARLAAAAPDMACVLLAVEWSSESACPICQAYEYEGKHKPDCALDAALRKAGVR